MPGRVSMDQAITTEAHSLKRKRAEQDDGESERPGPGAHLDLAQGVQQLNGPPNPGRNGELSNGSAVNISEGRLRDRELSQNEAMDKPPQLDTSWRESTENKSLGKLMERLAQTCYADLNTAIAQMAEAHVQTEVLQPNGVVPHGPQQDTSDSSLAKKRTLLQFADEQRDRFTKTLVLSDWARKEEDVASLIDIRVWQQRQRDFGQSAAWGIGEAKRAMVGFKMPAPNIEGALRLFASSEAAGLSDLGYVPPKRLTAKQLLRTLKDMNVTLATRVSLHEELPPYMQDYRVANGRVTFTVPAEFEVDLSVADEDPGTPFYFIDIRLSFQPTTNLLDDRLRGFLESRVNEALASKGLKGCYDFLHNLVLTQKLNILRSQAVELVRGKWFDCIQVQHMRRHLIVQYWSGLPGRKNWIEIGISSGKAKPSDPGRLMAPALTVRWFRRGDEITNEPLDFDWQVLDMEKCITQVIDKHVHGKLAQIASDLRALSPRSTIFSARFEGRADVPEGMHLSLNLTTLRAPLDVRIEPVSGRLSLHPATAASADCEQYLNAHGSIDTSKALAQMLCTVALEQMSKQAELVGWMPVRNLSRAQLHFGEHAWQRAIYTCDAGWGHNWALGISFGLDSMQWWIVHLDQAGQAQQGAIVARQPSFVRELIVEDFCCNHTAFSRPALEKIGRMAVAEVSFTVLSQELRTLGIPHRIENALLRGDASSPDVWPKPGPPTMLLRLSSLLSHDIRDEKVTSWATDCLRLTHRGMKPSAVQHGSFPAPVRHDLRLSLEPDHMKLLRQHLTHTWNQDVAMTHSGGMAVQLLTPFGEPFVEDVQKRLGSVMGLDRHISVLHKLGFACTSVTLSKLDFVYSRTPKLSAQLSLTGDDRLPFRIQFHPANDNPHQKIRVMLEHVLNTTRKDALGIFCHLLTLTLPLLLRLERLEVATPAGLDTAIHVHSAGWYSLVYKASLQSCSFQFRLRRRVQGGKSLVKWHLEGGRAKSGSNDQAEGLVNALTEQVWQSKGDGWAGIGNGAVADAQGSARLLERLDVIVRQHPQTDEPTETSANGRLAQDQVGSDERPGNASKAAAIATATAPSARPPSDVITID